MLSRWSKFFLCSIFVLFVTGASFAGSIGTDTIWVVNTFGSSSNGDLTGPYQFQDSSNNTFLTMCFDANHDISYGVQYNTAEYSLGTLTTSDNVEFKGTTLTLNGKSYNDVQIYEAEAYLDQYLMADFNTNTDSLINTATGVALQDAAWALFDPTGGWAPVGSAAYNDELAALQNALNNTANINYSNFIIYSPTGSYGQGQMEMLPTPEPASLALFGSGLFALGGVVRRRFKKS